MRRGREETWPPPGSRAQGPPAADARGRGSPTRRLWLRPLRGSAVARRDQHATKHRACGKLPHLPAWRSGPRQREPGAAITLGTMVRRDETDKTSPVSRCSSPAGASPASVSTGAPSSRPQPCGENHTGQAGCQEPLRREPVRGPQHEVKLAASSHLQPERRAQRGQYAGGAAHAGIAVWRAVQAA